MIRPFATEFGLFLAPFVSMRRFCWRRAPASCIRMHGRRGASPVLSSCPWFWWRGAFSFWRNSGARRRARPTCRRISRTANSCRRRRGDSRAASWRSPWLKAGPGRAPARAPQSRRRRSARCRRCGSQRLVGLPVGEIDVATTALPEEIVRRIEAAGGKAIPTGIEHGTVTAVIDQHAR